MKNWSLKKLVNVAAEICDYALDYYDTGECHRPETPWPDDDPNHSLAWSALGASSYTLACIAAQHTPKGRNGVESEAPFYALRMWEFMSLKKRRRLAKAFFEELGAQKKYAKKPHQPLVANCTPVPPHAPPMDEPRCLTPGHDSDCDGEGGTCDVEGDARPFCDMEPEDLQREVEEITKTYALWTRRIVRYEAKDAPALRHAMERAMSHRMSLAFCDRRTRPRVGDKVVTLKGDNDCDGNDQPRQALPGAVGKVTDVDDDRFHVVFDESEVWVVLEFHEICDPEQYTWEP